MMVITLGTSSTTSGKLLGRSCRYRVPEGRVVRDQRAVRRAFTLPAHPQFLLGVYDVAGDGDEGLGNSRVGVSSWVPVLGAGTGFQGDRYRG